LKVQILSPGFTTPNSRGLLYPLVLNRKKLRDCGITVTLRNQIGLVRDADVLIIDSKYFKPYWAQSPEYVLELLEKFRSSVDRVLWFNTADSTGSIQVQVFPYVDRYLKGQLLTDRCQYLRSFYGKRIFTQYYHDKYSLIDDREEYSRPLLSSADLDKLELGWNYGLANMYTYSKYWTSRLRYLIPVTHSMFTKLSKDRKKNRENVVFCRMATNYPRKTISFQREQVLRSLKGYTLNSSNVSRWAYFRELKRSLVALSPFGWGEINIRDFEAFASGVPLLKPSMEHLETYPHFYRPWLSYVPFKWDMSDLCENLEKLLEDKNLLANIGETGRNKFLSQLDDAQRNKFVAHFKKIVAADPE